MVQSEMVPWGTGATSVVFTDGHGDDFIASVERTTLTENVQQIASLQARATIND